MCHNARRTAALRKFSAIIPLVIVGVLIHGAGRSKEQKSGEDQAALKCVPLYCAECTVSLVGLRVQMAVICASVRRRHPNLASAQLLNQINLVHVKKNAVMMMIVKETRSAAPMAAVMSVLPQNTKPSQVTVQQLTSIMLVFAKVNAAQIVTVREIRNVVVTAVVVSAVLLCDKLAPVVPHSCCVWPIPVKDQAARPTLKPSAVRTAVGNAHLSSLMTMTT